MGKLVDYVAMPLFLPCIGLWYLMAYLLAILGTMLIFPGVLLAQRLYWCCPFIPYIWKGYGPFGNYLRVAFEASYCINVLKRLLTLPLRKKLPDFYIVGFPVTPLNIRLLKFNLFRKPGRPAWRRNSSGIPRSTPFLDCPGTRHSLRSLISSMASLDGIRHHLKRCIVLSSRRCFVDGGLKWCCVNEDGCALMLVQFRHVCRLWLRELHR